MTGPSYPFTIMEVYGEVERLLSSGEFGVLAAQDGAIVGYYDGITPTTMWYPVHLWQEGEMIRVETPMLSIGRLRDAMVAVVQPTSDPWSVDGRLQPIERVGDQPLELFEGGLC